MKRRRGKKSFKGTFNPDDVARVKHTRIGVWDLYAEKQPEVAYLPAATRLEQYWESYQGLPYVWRMVCDVARLKGCWLLLGLYMLVEIVASLLPAVSLWYSGQLLKIVQEAVDTRTVDTSLLFHVATGRTTCMIASRVLQYIKQRLSMPLNRRIKHYYSTHIFHALARLDVPTFDDPNVQRQIESTTSQTGRSSLAWDTVVMAGDIIGTFLKLLSQVSVLIGVLRDQRDGPLLAVLSLSQSLLQYFNYRTGFFDGGVWAATTTDDDYIRMEGLKRTVNNPEHRKEVVAGNMSEYLTSQYREAVRRVGDKAGDFVELFRIHKTQNRFTLSSLINEPLRELPQASDQAFLLGDIVFTLRAVQYPASIPLSLASLNLIQQTSSAFSHGLLQFVEKSGSVAEQVVNVRRLYEIDNIPNKIADGKAAFPEDTQKTRLGISIEFRNVSFAYAGSERYALRNISFKVSAGQLCVIVGTNGSGKSTILKLIARIYDPSEGQILVDGKDITSIKLADLRRTISVLFQDFSHFPLSIKENIGLGNPELATDEDSIQEAARLGGAEEFINALPDGFDTYLERPVRDYYSALPEGTKTLFGRAVDFSRVRGVGGLQPTSSTSLSGGQMQRLAVSRTFMRSLVSDASQVNVSLLLFDEPSASLDPSAEHDLFERLRKLRGDKTMIFSSHRFGNLTRHADVILYMEDSGIVEVGTHSSLLQKGGDYARIWKLQAQAFI
ncbi:hypothetical protein JAAARDRAFT_209162 [Jaapia argillacea MUCL 33604]|uniref:ABC transporter domain-containing protein n=1 Tax=Jaapia argillacea MUCL 33604 TaxID=933084 RepID=A0A067PME8_9AGAM|nr:hypothetical protein JAAARDRAFT_209162 [Jaapia argillacea MUCL 33604]